MFLVWNPLHNPGLFLTIDCHLGQDSEITSACSQALKSPVRTYFDFALVLTLLILS